MDGRTNAEWMGGLNASPVEKEALPWIHWLNVDHNAKAIVTAPSR